MAMKPRKVKKKPVKKMRKGGLIENRKEIIKDGKRIGEKILGTRLQLSKDKGKKPTFTGRDQLKTTATGGRQLKATKKPVKKKKRVAVTPKLIRKYKRVDVSAAIDQQVKKAKDKRKRVAVDLPKRKRVDVSAAIDQQVKKAKDKRKRVAVTPKLIEKGKGGAVKKMRGGGMVKKMRGGGMVKKMRKGGAVRKKK